jgi:hypothetical protein
MLTGILKLCTPPLTEVISPHSGMTNVTSILPTLIVTGHIGELVPVRAPRIVPDMFDARDFCSFSTDDVQGRVARIVIDP